MKAMMPNAARNPPQAATMCRGRMRSQSISGISRVALRRVDERALVGLNQKAENTHHSATPRQTTAVAMIQRGFVGSA
jgi:hypothetical protein